jgi:hypothetical protein
MKYIFSLFLILQTIIAQEKFNIFKSYADSKRKPPQYSREKKHLRHSVEEYLDAKQLQMYKIRYSPDKSDVMFDSNWSGFKKNNLRSSI